MPDSQFRLLSSGARKVRALAAPLVALALMAGGAAHAQAYINLTAGGAFAPGVYGQISIGNNPPPPVINAQPVIVGQPVIGAPIMYLNVPVEQSHDWARYCGRYNACGRPVHFVRVDPREPWWDHHNEHLRGEDHYRHEEEHYRHDEDHRRHDDDHRH